MNGVRRLGVWSATALVVANMVGTGVFTTSGFLLADLKSPWLVLLAWLIGGLLATCGALSYGALARAIPQSGGEYTFLCRTLHPALGSVAGWVSLLVGFSAPLAAAAFGFGEYAKAGCADCSAQGLGSVLLLGLALLHGGRVERAAKVQNVAVFLKVLFIVLFAAWALPRLPSLPLASLPDVDAGAFWVALVWISFSYSGWNAAVYVAGEVQDPEHALPNALLAGTAAVTLLYLVLNAAFVFAAPVKELAGRPDIAYAAALALGSEVWADALAFLVALALATSSSAMMMAGPRVYSCMATDGLLPPFFAAGPKALPRGAALQCGLALLLLWSATFAGLLTYIGFTLGLCAAATVAGLIRLKLREGERLKVIGWPWAPVLFLLGVFGTSVFSVIREPSASGYGVATAVLGWLSWRLKRVMSASVEH